MLTNTHVSRLCKAFANNYSANIKLAKTQLLKIGLSGRFLGRLLGKWLITGLPLVGNVYRPVAKSVLIPLRLTAAASATDAAAHNKIVGSVRPLDLASHNTALIISNEEMNDIMKVIKPLEESDLLIKGISKTIINEAKECY